MYYYYFFIGYVVLFILKSNQQLLHKSLMLLCIMAVFETEQLCSFYSSFETVKLLHLDKLNSLKHSLHIHFQHIQLFKGKKNI